MELNEANQIINSAKATMRMDGYSIAPNLETLGALALLGVNTIESSVAKLTASSLHTTACVFFRLLELESNAPPLVYDTETLLFLHKSIHLDFKSDCGELRKINISKNGASCINYRILQASLKTVLSQMKTTETNKLILKTDFAARLAHFMRELLILSPFAYGNGLVCRLFFELYSKQNGFNLDYYKSGYKEFSSAETIALTTDDVQPLFKCLVKSLTYRRFVNSNHAIDSQVRQTEKLSSPKPIIIGEAQSRAVNRRHIVIERPSKTQPSAHTKTSTEAQTSSQNVTTTQTAVNHKSNAKTQTPNPPHRVFERTVTRETLKRAEQKTTHSFNKPSPATETTATNDRKSTTTTSSAPRYSREQFTEVTKAEIIPPDKKEFPTDYNSQKTLVIEESSIISDSSNGVDFTVIPQTSASSNRSRFVNRIRRTINKI